MFVAFGQQALSKGREADTQSSFAPTSVSASVKQALGIFSVSLFVLAPSSYAEEANVNVLEEITVTAEKRDADVMDISSSVSVKTEDNLKDKQITSVTELGQATPSLHVFSWGGGFETNVFIRGIGPGLFTEPTTGFYVDGVNYSNSGLFDLSLVDVESIEVLRGPQGSLYGGNSLAGVINIKTKKPTNYSEGKVFLSYDSLSEATLSAAYNTPLIDDKLLSSVSISTTQSDGYIDNISDGSEFGENDDILARTSLDWLVSEDLDVNLTLNYERTKDDAYPLALLSSSGYFNNEIDQDFDGVNERDSMGLSLSVTRVFENYDFNSVTGFHDTELKNSADQDATSNANNLYHSSYEEELSELSQELRWSSTSDAPLQWLGGFYAYSRSSNGDAENDVNITAYGASGTDYSEIEKEDSGVAAFGQLDYSVTDKLVLTTGLRWDYEKRKADLDYIANSGFGASSTIQGEESYSIFLPKLAASYQLNQETKIYSSISQGYRAGGFDDVYPDVSDPTYDEEVSTSYEVGYKASFLENKLDLMAAVYFTEIKDQQVQQTEGYFTVTNNAGLGRSQGVEMEVRYIPAQNWLLEFGVNLSDASYVDYENCSASGDDCSGNDVAYAPDVTANLGIQRRAPLTSDLDLFTNMTVSYIDDFYFDGQNLYEQEAYSLVNAKVGLEADDWDIHLWAKNLLDEDYSSVQFNQGLGLAGEAGQSRSVGINFTKYL